MTKFVPPEKYGHFTALMAAADLLGLLLSTFGVEDAVAREGAGLRARGQASDRHAAAIFSRGVGSAYAAVAMVVLPDLFPQMTPLAI